MPQYPGRMRNVTAFQRAQAEAFPITVHRRFTAAELNAGADLLAPAPGSKYRMIDLSMIAVGGAVSGATDVRIKGTQNGASVDLIVVLVAALTQGKMVRMGGPTPDMALQNNGVSHQPCDAGTAIKIAKTGGTLAGATHLDIIGQFLLEG